jgi:hypothetical protein
LAVAGTAPTLTLEGRAVEAAADDPLGVWEAVLDRLLRSWV